MRVPSRLLVAAAAASVVILATGAASVAQVARGVTPDVRSFDGLNNNLARPRWGLLGTPLPRGTSGAHYTDGRSAPAGQKRPLARHISNTIFRQQGSIPNTAGLSDYIWTWG